MAFSCHILLSMVHPGCAMLWRSPNMNFPCHQRVRKLLGLMALVNGATRPNLLKLEMQGSNKFPQEKSNKCNQCEYASSQATHLKTHLKMHSGEKYNKCNQCDYVSSCVGNLRAHLKMHSAQWGKVKQMQPM